MEEGVAPEKEALFFPKYLEKATDFPRRTRGSSLPLAMPVRSTRGALSALDLHTSRSPGRCKRDAAGVLVAARATQSGQQPARNDALVVRSAIDVPQGLDLYPTPLQLPEALARLLHDPARAPLDVLE